MTLDNKGFRVVSNLWAAPYARPVLIPQATGGKPPAPSDPVLCHQLAPFPSVDNYFLYSK